MSLWSENADFSDRKVNYHADPLFSEAARQISDLLEWWEHDRIVEVGSGSGAYLEHLNRLTGVPVVGSDIMSPRLIRARQEHPHIAFEEADAVTMAAKQGPRTLIVAMNVLGNLSQEDVAAFFAAIKPGQALTFCARGVMPDAEPAQRKNGTWDHNYKPLLEGFHLYRQLYFEPPKMPDRLTYIVTATR